MVAVQLRGGLVPVSGVEDVSAVLWGYRVVWGNTRNVEGECTLYSLSMVRCSRYTLRGGVGGSRQGFMLGEVPIRVVSSSNSSTTSADPASSSRENEDAVWVVEEVVGGDQESVVGVFDSKLDALAFAHEQHREVLGSDEGMRWGSMARQKIVDTCPRDDGASSVLSTHVVPFVSSEDDMWTWMVHRSPVQ